MTFPLDDRMREILALTSKGKLGEATALIQESLGQLGQAPATSWSPANDAAAGALIDQHEPARPTMLLTPRPVNRAAEHLRGSPAPATPAGSSSFARHSFRGEHGRLDYFLYVPATIGEAMPLVVMLHGCTQSAEDFARGTRMNEVAEEFGFLVAYPEQTQGANMQKCWNWFRPGDQVKDLGEPALIAGIAREIAARHPVDGGRIYVAGLSAGGAAAAIMANAYPDLFAAAGIHSGLACGSARDLPSALAAMKGKGSQRSAKGRAYVPLITFHGDRDSTVDPANSDQIHAAWRGSRAMASLSAQVEEGVSPGGRRYRRTAQRDSAGTSMAESWEISGAGHAWSGGSPTGSFTDTAGPDASREMVRFFLQHRLAGQSPD